MEVILKWKKAKREFVFNISEYHHQEMGLLCKESCQPLVLSTANTKCTQLSEYKASKKVELRIDSKGRAQNLDRLRAVKKLCRAR